jgi:hypothetical protein
MPETIISSPSVINFSPNEKAIVLIEAVVPAVNIISCSSLAPINS